MATQSSTSGVKSALRTLDMIEYVVAHRSGVVAQEISEALNIPVSSLSYLLGTLLERGYLRRDGRRYYAGIGLERLRLPQGEVSLAERAQPFVKALVNRLNETTSVFVRADWEMEAIVTQSSSHMLRYARDVGTRSPMYCTSAGKALLATLSDADLERYLREVPLTPITPYTIVDRDAFVAQIAEVRASGFAVTRDELEVGISAVGSVIHANGQAVAALSVACPTVRFTPEVQQQIIGQIMATVATLGDTLSHA